MEYSDPKLIVNSFSQDSTDHLLQALDLIAERLRLHYDGLGTPLIYHSGHWRTFRNAAWRPLDRRGRRELVSVIARLAESVGLQPVPRWLNRHLRDSMLFVPPGWRPFRRNVGLVVAAA